MDSEADVLLQVDAGVAIVTLNRPDRLNAIHRGMAAELVDLFRRLRYDDDVHAIVLTGAGRAFCAGADLSSERTTPPSYKKSPQGPFADLTRSIVAADKPVIAAIAGHAVGAGLSYALAADRRIADRTARLSAIFVRRGLAPDCGISYFLPRLAGLPMALKLVTTGATLDADEALAAGLIDELVDEGEALPAALRYARDLAAGASVAIDLARRGVYMSLSSTLDEVLAYEDFAASVAAGTEDAQEGLQAFAGKRPPAFRGR